jgi:magnesium-transporting ATPase (P-type)
MVQNICDWLAETALSQLFARSEWFVPTVQTIHILSVAVVVTTLAMLDFKLLNLTQSGSSVPPLARSFLPWTWKALGVLLVTGVLLTITEPSRELLNNAFRLKMLLVLALAGVTFTFQRVTSRDPQYWRSSPRGRRLASAIAVVSLMLCVTIVAAGRMIGYL